MCGRWPALWGRPRSTGRGGSTTRSQCPRTNSISTGRSRGRGDLLWTARTGTRSNVVDRSAEPVPAEEAEHVVRGDHRPAARAALLDGGRLRHWNRRDRLGRGSDLGGRGRRARHLRFGPRGDLSGLWYGWRLGRSGGLDIVARRGRRRVARGRPPGPGGRAAAGGKPRPRRGRGGKPPVTGGPGEGARQ